jgi:hypothetical protein
VIALLVVLGALGLGAAGVGVAVALGARTTPDVATAPAGPAPDSPTSPASAASTPSAGRGGPDGPTGATTSVAREVLRDWDRRRETAWVAADPRALATLYLADSVAGTRDVRSLRRWSDRGARVTLLQPQVLSLEVVRDVGRTLVVRVTDRLRVEATLDGRPVALPQDEASTRRIVLRRGPSVTSSWRVAAVGGVGALAAPGSLGE